MSAGYRTRWGWHQLTSPFAAQVAAHADLSRDDIVLDLGAGSGSLTRELANTGAQVTAIELNNGRVAELRRRFGCISTVTVVRADIATVALPDEAFHVVANPPFALTPIVFERLLCRGSKLESAVLVLQRDAAKRRVEKHSSMHGRWFDFEIIENLPRKAFHPRPNVDTAVLGIKRR